MCDGKQRFTAKEARQAAKKQHGKVDVFRCRFCGCYHLGRLRWARQGKVDGNVSSKRMGYRGQGST